MQELNLLVKMVILEWKRKQSQKLVKRLKKHINHLSYFETQELASNRAAHHEIPDILQQIVEYQELERKQLVGLIEVEKKEKEGSALAHVSSLL
ncbi:hypothetical protein PoB_000262500 [Plakobranchus ocellatus]|uniref:Uncharacterized protein n=1 Tax=Plakobranchus ocellatus TaxID=259542 RepID=A0AAV3Y0A1_9GAST|nr:hypothetical protein PoB_000262500 [Plakobranchus ocellatus]